MGCVGTALRRAEDSRLLQGKGTYVADLRLPGMVHMAVLRSPHGNARIVRIDASRARAVPGVLAAWTAVELGEFNRPIPVMVPHPAMRGVQQRPLAADSVRMVGEAVALVVAPDRYAAEDARERIVVTYEDVPVVPDAVTALAPGAPVIHAALGDNVTAQVSQSTGDPEIAFRAAPHRLRERLRIQRGSGQAIECRAVAAHWDPASGQLTVWDSHQAPFLVRTKLAELLDYPEHLIRVVAPDVGGGFGPKAVFYPEDLLVPLLAMRLRQPVSWVEDRYEHLITSVQEREQEHDVEVAFDVNGRLLATRDRIVADNGAYVPYGINVPLYSSTGVFGPYDVRHFAVETTIAYTNRVPVSPVRGAGQPQGTFVIERMMDRIGQHLGIDPAEVRFRNFVQPEQFPFATGLRFRDGTPLVYDSGDYPQCLRKAMETIGYHAFRAAQRDPGGGARYRGIGIGCFVETTGLGPYEGATVRVDLKGRVVVSTGVASQGQGHHTSLAQICADRLGVEPSVVTVIEGDTAAFAYGIGTFASRVAVVAGSAVALAADQVREKAKALAADVLEAAPEDLEVRDGRVFVKGSPGRTVGFGELAVRARGGQPNAPLPEGRSPGLEATSHFSPTQAAFSSGAHAAIVTVDAETGAIAVERYVVVHDCGAVINPMIVEGQMHGGVAHGLSEALFEYLRFDERAQPLATTFQDYLLITAPEMPPMRVEHVETRSPLNPLGIKGAGESGIIPVHATIASAVEDALRPLGVRINSMPIVPHELLAQIAEGTGQGKRL